MGASCDTRTIGEHRYKVTQLGAVKGRALFVRLTKALGPALAALVGGGNVRVLLQVDVSSLGPMLVELTERITEDELAYFCETLGGCSEILGATGNTVKLDPNVLDVHFAGHILDMFKWLGFALEVQFADFLSVWKATRAGASMVPTSAASPSQNPSIGISGAS